MALIYDRQARRRGADPGIVWPGTGSESPSTLGDPFGERTFSGGTGHSGGTDFHRGQDEKDNADGVGEAAGTGGAPIYSPVNGTVIRKHYGNFMFFDSGNMDELTEVDPNSKATFTRNAGYLRIVGKNDGTVTFASGLAMLKTLKGFDCGTTGNDFGCQFILSSTPGGAWGGKLVIGYYDAGNNEYVALEYNGSTFTCKGKKSSGVMTNDGATTSPSARKYGAVWFDQAGGKVYWKHSTDGNTWTDIVGAGEAWTVTNPGGFRMFIGWDPAASAADDTVDVAYFGGGHANSINRFGNWLEIATESKKFCLMHFRHISINLGDVVRTGQQVGLSGKTGFDLRSGQILQNHCHVEYNATNAHDYANSDPTNPLSASIMPRVSTAPSISVVRDTAMDPNTGAVDCHRLTITLTRGTYQNFQINEMQMVGNTTSRTLNWNTRAGLDPADQDANVYSGLYFQPVAFNESSATYVFKLYASKAVIGSTWVSGYVKDADGNTIWSG